MTWIKTQSPAESHAVSEVLEKLQALYPKEYDASRRHERLLPDLVKNDSIMLSHSLIPQAMYHAFATYGAAMTVYAGCRELSRTIHKKQRLWKWGRKDDYSAKAAKSDGNNRGSGTF